MLYLSHRKRLKKASYVKVRKYMKLNNTSKQSIDIPLSNILLRNKQNVLILWNLLFSVKLPYFFDDNSAVKMVSFESSTSKT